MSKAQAARTFDVSLSSSKSVFRNKVERSSPTRSTHALGSRAEVMVRAV